VQAIALAPPASEVQALARFEQAAAAEQANFDAHLFAALLEKRFKSGPVNEEAVAAALTALEGRLDGYERILAKQRYLAGDVRPVSSPSKWRRESG
jgi:glutathione S-transferase